MLHRSFFWGKDGWSNGRREETGDQGAHKNVQEAWLYIRALEILLGREREERKGKKGRKREQMAASNNLETGCLKKKKPMSGGVDVDGCRGACGWICVDVCACIVHYSQTYINKNKLC